MFDMRPLLTALAASTNDPEGPPWYVLVLAGVLATALLAFLVRLLLDRRAERARARGPARIVRGELDSAIESLEDCLDTGYWTPREPLALPTWESERTNLGSALASEELLVMRAAERWIEDANDVGRSRRSQLNEAKRERVKAALHAMHLARRAIEPVAEGRGGLVRTRRTPEAIAPHRRAPRRARPSRAARRGCGSPAWRSPPRDGAQRTPREPRTAARREQIGRSPGSSGDAAGAR